MLYRVALAIQHQPRACEREQSLWTIQSRQIASAIEMKTIYSLSLCPQPCKIKGHFSLSSWSCSACRPYNTACSNALHAQMYSASLVLCVSGWHRLPKSIWRRLNTSKGGYLVFSFTCTGWGSFHPSSSSDPGLIEVTTGRFFWLSNTGTTMWTHSQTKCAEPPKNVLLRLPTPLMILVWVRTGSRWARRGYEGEEKKNEILPNMLDNIFHSHCACK